MDILSMFRESYIAIVIAFIAALTYSLLWFARSTGKKRLPPEAGGAWPIIGHLHLLSGSLPPHIIIGDLAAKYGPIFSIKIGVHRTLVVSNWELAKECLKTNDKAFSNRPTGLASEILGYNYSMFGLSPYGSYWRQIRRIVTHELLSSVRLERLKLVREGEFKAAVGGLYQKWMENANSTQCNKLLVEMKKWLRDVTLNVIIKITMGKLYAEYKDITSEGDNYASDGWRDSVRNFFELMGKYAVSDSLPFLRFLDLGGVEKAMEKTFKELDSAVERWLEEHRVKKISGAVKEEEDFMDVLLSVLDDTKEIEGRSADTVIKSTCLAIILASSDTSSVTLIWTLSLLLNHPDVLKKAQQELDIHVGRERQVNEADMKNLVYLQAIIKESFRVCPPVPLSVPRESIEDCVVGGYHIPAGTRLLVNVAKIHQDPLVWPDPGEFKPERFLSTHKDVDVRGHNFELIPFGSGRRIFPGISFSLPVLSLALATLLHGFEMETPSGKPVDMSGTGGLSNFKATPLEALLTPRLPAHLYEITK
ncbi:hypothetical protein Tsubulata_022688 [Turnera subulata]|uniref:Cytochrome P450 n=1 Tax=Turnera subulata TaxID=218843 RepID=A0A9Q0FAT8_9ROSI|nr:hypothetical protein Tsubulata_022688 [Turnera subulata]